MTLRQHVRGVLFKGPMMISCKELDTFIVDYLDGQLPRWRRFVFELHLLLCRECRDYLARYRRAMSLSGPVLAQTDQMPDDLPDGLVRAVLSALGRRGEDP